MEHVYGDYLENNSDFCITTPDIPRNWYNYLWNDRYITVTSQTGADRVEEDIQTILPFRNPIVNGRAEPYVMCNSYFGEQTGYRYGTPGQSWRTAAGQWFQKALVNYVFGLQPEMDGLHIRPCLPPSWKNCAITKRFRDTTYHITYENKGTSVKTILVDGKPLTGDALPLTGGTVEVCVITG